MNIEKDTVNFANQTYMLMFLQRYNTRPRIFNETVAAHSYQVSVLSLFLYNKYKNKVKINFEKMISMGLIHDIGEVATGDIVHPVKDKYPELDRILCLEEKRYVKKILGKKYSNLISEYNDGKTIESLLVEMADIISCYIYSKEEVKLGNTNMKRIVKDSEKRMKKLNKEIKLKLK